MQVRLNQQPKVSVDEMSLFQVHSILEGFNTSDSGTDIPMEPPLPAVDDEHEKVGITNPETLAVEVKLPQTCFSARRTAVKTADNAGIPQNQIGRVIERAHAMSRVAAHRDKLEELKQSNHEGKITFKVKLAMPVESFARRDDFGNDANVNAIQIACYQHEDPVMQQAGQHVWILHAEMLGKEKPQTGMSSPAACGNFSDCS